MSGYNEGATFDRDDDALITDLDASVAGETGEDVEGPSAGGDRDLGDSRAGLEDVGETTPGLADTTAGGTDAAQLEFEGRLGDATTADASATTADAGFGDSAPDGFSSDTEETYRDSGLQPETQGEDPVYAELGEEGQGDLAPEDV